MSGSISEKEFDFYDWWSNKGSLFVLHRCSSKLITREREQVETFKSLPEPERHFFGPNAKKKQAMSCLKLLRSILCFCSISCLKY